MWDMKILVVDDDLAIRGALRRVLHFNRYSVVEASCGEEALSLLEAEQPSLVILEIVLPGLDGLSVVRSMRERGDETPVLILSQKGEIAERVAGLDAGADDYLPKPFATEELMARTRALLRRSVHTHQEVEEAPNQVVFGDLVLNPDTREVTRGDRSISLTRTEFSLLHLLMRNQRTVLSRDTILKEVWGFDFPTSGNALEVYIGYLRRKTEQAGESRIIHTVRGVGYTLREQAL